MASHLGNSTLREKKGDMSILRQLRNCWILWVTTIALACFGDVVAQTSYTVTDLGVLHDNWNLSCAMALNNHGWMLSMNGLQEPVSNFIGANPAPATPR